MKVAILGTGVMGEGIAQLFASKQAISRLMVIGRSKEKIELVKLSIDRYLKKLSKRKLLSDSEIKEAIEKISFHTDFSIISYADIIVEAVSENIAIKEQIFSDISKVVNPSSIVASNTSSFSITHLASFLPVPENCIGLHFFNPVTHMELVEVVSAYHTSKDTIEKAINFISLVSKEAVIVEDSPGFIVNRMLIPMINEAVGILAERVASAEDIDRAMKFGANHPMGPLALSDLIGNDVTLSIMDTLHIETGDAKYRAHPLLRKMVRARALGRKTKMGFYNY